MRVAILVTLTAALAWGQALSLAGVVVSDAEGGPAVSAERRFAPGETVFLRFSATNFRKQDDTHRYLIEYKIEALDPLGTPFALSVSDRILSQTLRSESRPILFSATVPSTPRPGKWRFAVGLVDVIGGGVHQADIPFDVSSPLPEPKAEFAVHEFRYFRSEYDDKPAEEPVFRPGETVYGRFYLSGFKTTENNRYKLSYGVTLTNPQGKTVFAEMQAVSESRDSFYPKLVVPGLISVRLEPAIRPGAYTIGIQARDDNSGKLTKAEFPVRIR